MLTRKKVIIRGKKKEVVKLGNEVVVS